MGPNSLSEVSSSVLTPVTWKCDGVGYRCEPSGVQGNLGCEILQMTLLFNLAERMSIMTCCIGWGKKGPPSREIEKSLPVKDEVICEH